MGKTSPATGHASKAVSSLIAAVLVTAIATIGLIVTMAVVGPMFSSAKSTTVVNSAFQNLETLNTAVKGVASETQGSKRTISLSVTDGFYKTNSTYDWLYFEYEPEEALRLTGTKGSVEVERGLEFADYFNWYVDGSKATPAWTNTSGEWTVSDYKYSGQNGLAYRNVSGPLENWKFSASISNVSGPTGGQVFALPTNPESLVSFWPFDNRSGSVAYDYSGNRNNGTLTNMNTTGNATSGWTTDAKFGSALKFDGVNDYITATIPQVNTYTIPVTISVWMYIPSEWTWINGAIAYFPATSYGMGIFRTATNNRLVFVTRIGGIASYGTINLDIQRDTWYHLTFVGNGTHFDAYANGTKINAAPASYGILAGANITSAFRLATANIYGGSGGGYFNGTIDEVMIFNRSLTQGEITTLYETSTKKLLTTGTQTITTKTNVSIVLANPVGQTKFDDVTVTRDRNELTMLTAYENIDINGTLRVGKGEHQIEIRHMGINTMSSRPIIQITSS